MAYVTLTNITVLDNPTAFTNPFQFEVTFDCINQLEDDLEWKITYVGSAENESNDQVLEEVLVGPVPVGTNKFVFQADPPNPELIPEEDKIGVTVVLVTCSYRDNEFVRVGYYVNNDFVDPLLADSEMTHEKIDISKLQRNILADKPRVTRFPIDWSPDNRNNVQDIKVENNYEDSMLVDEDQGRNILNNSNSEDFFDDELIKAAAELDSKETELVIGEGIDDMEDEEDDDEDDEDEMDLDGEECIDIDI